MKKYAIIILVGGMLGLAACGDNKNTTTQEQIDSAANARSAAMEADMKAKNDSLINAMAKMRADSAMRADSIAKLGMTKASVTHTARTVTTTHATRPKTETQKVNDIFTPKTDAQKAKEAKKEENKVNDIFKK